MAQGIDHVAPFISKGRTGTGSEETIAHQLGRVPDLVMVFVHDSSTATYIQGTHTGTGILVTVTNNKVYDVLAW